MRNQKKNAKYEINTVTMIVIVIQKFELIFSKYLFFIQLKNQTGRIVKYALKTKS